MPTSSQREFVRYQFAATEDNLSDDEIDFVYGQAETRYGVNNDATEAYVRLVIIRNLMMQAAKRTDYKQNQSQEWLSQLLPNLIKMKAEFEDELTLALESTNAPVFIASLRRRSPVLVEYPSDFPSLVGSSKVDVSRLDES